MLTAIIIILILGALLGASSLGGMIRTGCAFILGLLLVLGAVIAYFALRS